ncbi:MAG TPA: polyprenyl synthetase family protein [Chthonomonas sp.]|uniref:polyprenyl synthetase family protein n=1 Tax=Chthonomonas sp. TaxID=2282153 RepID=UPI002B4B0A02|nr:polyprenyl synthetase family protein [Chthonomonas sp.]HLI48109.1 polyprenyl synthetase family protein [Chthonomonas sp.]
MNVVPISTTKSSGIVATAAFLQPVRADLQAVEARMQAELGSDVRTISALSRHLLEAGGKRLRPAMVALAARAVNPNADPTRVATVGAAMEFVHMATLVHDDVVDNTAIRRGRPTANAVYGNGVAVLSGDYILARSMRLLALDGDLRIIRTVSEVTIDMSEGEVMEIVATGRIDLPIPEYFEILRKKTAVFVEGCCRCGAILGGADETQEEALAEYGFRIGMAFQIVDDLLDYVGDPAITGKPRGSDLRDGRATLPLLLALEEIPAERKTMLLDAFGNPNLGEEAVDAVCNLLESAGAFEKTQTLAQAHVECAKQSLALLPETPSRASLELLAAYIAERNY